MALLALTLTLAGGAPEWKIATPDYPWDFPADSWAHQGFRNEWWYFTGQLTPPGGSQPRFGYQFTIFRIGLLAEPGSGSSRWHTADLLMGHAAVTDLQTGRHLFSEVLHRAIPDLAVFEVFPQPRLAWSRAPAGGPGSWSLQWNGDGFDLEMRDSVQRMAFRLTTRGARQPLLQGPNGYSRKTATGTAASHYYSFPDLATTGWIEVEGHRTELAGTTWMDQEFSSNVLQDDQVGWDWFSLRMHDGDVWMLFQLRDRQGATNFASGTRRRPDGSVDYLVSDDFDLSPLSHWRSTRSNSSYPVRWRVQPRTGTAFIVEALVDDQENHSILVPGLSYWEGAVRALDREGGEIGRGYLELTGYGPGTRPPL